MTTPCPWKVTPLMLASKDGYLSKVKGYIADQFSLEESDDNGDTALNLAAENGHLEILTTLIKAGAKIDVPNNRSETALLLAERWQRYTCMIALLRSGASLWHEDKLGYSFDKRHGGFEWWGNADEACKFIQDKIDNADGPCRFIPDEMDNIGNR